MDRIILNYCISCIVHVVVGDIGVIIIVRVILR